MPLCVVAMKYISYACSWVLFLHFGMAFHVGNYWGVTITWFHCVTHVAALQTTGLSS